MHVLNYAIADAWPDGDYGNHRVVLHVDAAGDVIARISWRRPDAHPEQVGLRLLHADTGEEVADLHAPALTREEGTIAFRAARPGEYHLYYLPCARQEPWYHPSTRYLPPVESAWRPTAEALPEAEVVRIEARTDFDRFDPMEVIATAAETRTLRAVHAGEAFLVFPEPRETPIRMTADLPAHWIARGPSNAFHDEARPGEYFVLQLGVYAVRTLHNLTATWSGDLPVEDITCVNLGGIDYGGQAFTKTLDVDEGRVQALWFGVAVPNTAGAMRGTLTLGADGIAPVEVAVTLDIAGDPLPDQGDNDLRRLSRLRWLNSTIGLDDTPADGFPSLVVDGRTVRVNGHAVEIGDDGLPAALRSFYAPTGERLVDTPTEILAAPMRFVAETAVGVLPWTDARVEITSAGPGRVTWAGACAAAGLSLCTVGTLEFDGHLDVQLTVTATHDLLLADLRLEMPLRAEAAVYLMGMGCPGGYRPARWEYGWNLTRANNAIWVGVPHAGVQLKLQYDHPVWELYTLEAHGLPASWDNGGRGGCTIADAGGSVLLTAFSGARSLHAGESVTYNFSLLLTPLKPLDPDAHWRHRYCHPSEMAADVEALVAESEATQLNLHHSFPQNPYINYPFLRVDRLADLARFAKARGLRTNVYYTIRELSVYAAEFWALRSLGTEIFRDGPGFRAADQFADRPSGAPTGGPWLCEHLREGYVPAWHCPLHEGGEDMSIATAGLSRWHNYYLEGLSWLLRESGVSGLYLDGVGYDRRIMQRVRKVMDRARPGGAIDFHSGNNFHPQYGLSSPANQYLELFPYVTSLWLGEGYDYNASPDFWLVEVSGIPFGLMGDMLDSGGHPWRGMLYGMSMHLYQRTDPRPLWRLWDALGLEGSRLVGYWTPNPPARPDHPALRATCYLKPGRAVIAIASWSDEEIATRLTFDLDQLGFTPSRLVALPVDGFQPAAVFDPNEPIAVPPNRGWVLICQ